MPDQSHIDPVRRELLERLATLPGETLDRNQKTLRLLLECPTWCEASHDPDDGDHAAGYHQSNRVDFGEVGVWVTFDKSDGDVAPRVVVNDHYFGSTEARQIAAELIRLADLIDPQSGTPLAVAQ